MKLNDILKIIGSNSSPTKIVIKENNKVIAIEPNLQGTLGYKANSFEYLAGINATEYDVKYFNIGDYAIYFYVTRCD